MLVVEQQCHVIRPKHRHTFERSSFFWFGGGAGTGIEGDAEVEVELKKWLTPLRASKATAAAQELADFRQKVLDIAAVKKLMSKEATVDAEVKRAKRDPEELCRAANRHFFEVTSLVVITTRESA